MKPHCSSRWSSCLGKLPLQISALFSGLIVVLIVGFLIRQAWPAFREVGLLRLFLDGSWNPADESGHATYGMTAMLLGTVYVAGGAILLASPTGLAVALFMRFYAPRWLASPYRHVIQLLAGIPSVVFGLWGAVVLVPWIGRYQPPGASVLAGVLILGMMILPTVALLAEVAIANVPTEYIRAAVALGMTRTHLIGKVLLPHAMAGLMTAVILQTGRAIGETMAVLMVCGNVVQFPGSVFDPVRTLTANIALQMGFAMDLHRAVLFGGGLILMSLVVVLVWIGHHIQATQEQAYG